MQDHRKLKVWQKARDLSVRVYRMTRGIARIDRSGYASQLNRAALSIRNNIAEGCGKPTNKDFAKFLHISIASACEVEDQLEYGGEVELLTPNDAKLLTAQVVEVRKMLYGLVHSVERESEQ